MGRRSGGGGGGRGFRSAPRAAPKPAPAPSSKPSSSAAPPPAKTASAQPPAHSSSNAPTTSVFGSLGSAVADGAAWGVGTSMAHRAMDSVLGPRTVRVVEEPSPASADACSLQNHAFSNCVYGNESDIGRCQGVFDMLMQCRRSGAGAGASTLSD